MKQDNPFAKLGALDQKLYQETTPKQEIHFSRKQEVQETNIPKDQQAPLPPREEDKAFKVVHYQSIDQPVDQSINQSTNRSIDQSINQSIKQLTNNLPPNNIVDRPKAFYITTRLDKRLDDAVRYFQDVHGIKKADRSTVVNAMLDSEENWTDKSLDRLVSRLISQLTSRLTGK
jgi:hypothetical protein